MITNILNSIIFPIELLLASYICAVRINKRSYWGLRMVLSFFFACVFMAAVNHLIPGNMLIKGSIAFLSTTLLSGLLLFWIYNIKGLHVLLYDWVCNAAFRLLFLYFNVGRIIR